MAATLVPSASATGLQLYRQIFLSSGTWTKPVGVKTARVRVVGGGAGALNVAAIGAGGGAGGYIDAQVDVSGISSATVTIGAGGVSSTSQGFVTDGGTSSFGTLIYSYGGQSYNGRWYENSTTNMVLCDSGQSENFQISTNGIASAKWIETYSGGPSTATSTNHLISPAGATTSNQQVMAYGNNILVAINRAVAGQTYTSSDYGVTWVLHSSAFTGTAQHISFNGTYFVIAINATGTSAYYSSDGVTWTASTLPTSQAWWGAVGGSGITVAYSASTATIAYSTNGTSWTASSLPVAPTAGYQLNYVNGNFIYTNGSTTAVYKSTNGFTWTSAGTLTAAFTATSVTYGNNLYMLWGGSNITTYYTSSDLATWTQRTIVLSGPTGAPTAGQYGIPTFIGNRWFIFAGVSGTSTFRADIYSSTDGINWVYVRSWTKGSLYTSTVVPNYALTQDVYQMPSGRYLVIASNNVSSSASNYRTAAWHFSDYLIGGYSGVVLPANTNSTPSYYTANGSAGSSSSIGLNINLYTTAGNLVYSVSLGGTGSPEGWCIGGNGWLGTTGANVYYFLGVNAVPPTYGSGATNVSSNTFGGTNGGQGVVVVEWWA